MREYHKIETLFKRDMEGNKKLIEGVFRNPLIEYIKDCKWLFSEKINGMNVRAYWDGHTISFGGRTDKAQMSPALIERLQELFAGNENEELLEQKFGDSEVIFFGEGYGGKIQKGKAYNPTQDFILFDVQVGDIFLERENVEEIAKSFGIKVVPIVLVGTIQEAVDCIKANPKSIVAIEDIEMEGVVGVPAVRINDFRGHRIIVKIKVKDFDI